MSTLEATTFNRVAQIMVVRTLCDGSLFPPRNEADYAGQPGVIN